MCGRTARTVRREGRTSVLLYPYRAGSYCLPYPYPTRAVCCKPPKTCWLRIWRKRGEELEDVSGKAVQIGRQTCVTPELIAACACRICVKRRFHSKFGGFRAFKQQRHWRLSFSLSRERERARVRFRPPPRFFQRGFVGLSGKNSCAMASGLNSGSLCSRVAPCSEAHAAIQASARESR